MAKKGVTPVAVKVEFIQWFLDPARRGTQGQWAKAHDLHPVTISKWLADDSEFKALLDAASVGQEQRFGQVIETMLRIATDPDHINCVQAANFLAKVFGRYKPEKVEATFVDRVAYVQPGALREQSQAVLARPN